MDVLIRDQGEYCFGPFRLAPSRRLLTCHAVPLKIQPRLYDTLVYLVINADRVVEKDELIAAVWPGRVIEDNNLPQSISALRRALQTEGSSETYISTVPNRGYRFVAPVRLERSDADAPAVPPYAAQPPGARSTGARPLARRRTTLAAAAALLAALAGTAALTLRHNAHPPPHSVAVLPFTNMSRDPDQAYFSDGISEELIGTLSRLDGLKVAARVSSFSFKGSQATAADIGRQLNVAALLEGSVRRDGDRVRITAELIDATTGYQLWSQRFDRQQGNLLQTQDEIAERVTQSLRVKLLGDTSAQLALGGTANAQAFDAYLRGRRLAASTQGSSDMVANDQAALADYDKALALDPNYALAEAARAVTLCSLSGSGRPSAAQRQQMESESLQLARRAVAIAPDLGMAYVQLATVLQVCSFDFAGAWAAMSRAVALDPGNADVLGAASALAAGTHPDRALPMAQLLVTLDPLNPDSYDGLAQAFFYGRRYPEAASALDHAATLRGQASVPEQDLRGLIALMRGDPATTVAICAGARNWHENVELAIAYQKLGNTQLAAAHAARVHEVLREAGAYQYAQIAAQWGNKDAALGWLDSAYQLRDHGLTALNADQLLDPVRDTARFRDVVRRLHVQS